MRKFLLALFLASLMLMTGCASSQMMQIPDNTPPYVPSPDKSTVVFMRPSAFGGAIQAYVFRYDAEEPDFVGIVSTNYKIAYQTEPGKHLFMVTGENTDFLEADLAPGHIYYVVVEPHIGFMKARFSLDPVPAADLGGEDFKEDLAECTFVKNTPESMAWFEQHKADILARYRDNYPDWQQDTEDQHHLDASMGVPEE